MSDGMGEGFDWAAIRGRLASLESALDEGRHSEQRTDELLRQRAARLATPEATEVRDAIEVLRFRHAGQASVIETRWVVSVDRLGPVTPLPGANHGVVGVAAWRGEPLIVRELDGAGARATPSARFALVLGDAAAEFALPVDEMPEVALLPRAGVRPAPAELAGDRPWLVGVTDRAELVIGGHELMSSTRRKDQS